MAVVLLSIIYTAIFLFTHIVVALFCTLCHAIHHIVIHERGIVIVIVIHLLIILLKGSRSLPAHALHLVDICQVSLLVSVDDSKTLLPGWRLLSPDTRNSDVVGCDALRPRRESLSH